MSNEQTQKSELIRGLLDGSLSSEQMPAAEELLANDAAAHTLVDPQDKIETFVNRLQEALAMPPFPAEHNDESNKAVRQAVAQQMKQPASAQDTAAGTVNDPEVSTDPESAPAKKSAITFLSPPQTPNELGRLNGYRVLKQLGEGGMGLVFEAEDIRLKRRVALKVMKPEVAAKEQHRQRFVREAEAAAKVEHDNICPIYQVGEENGVPFIAMPFLKGEPLDALLKRQKPLPLSDAVRIGREVAEGLSAAHDAGLVHRDIKPGNIWQETLPNGRIRSRILDFGLARAQGDDVHITASGAVLGTPAYMAPEQARGKAVDHRADLFSLGVMLYEMTTGRRPFTGNDTMSILTSLAIDEPTAPHLINPAIPAQLSALIMRLLSKSPDKRPANGRVVADGLLAILMQTSRPIVENIAPNGRTSAAPLAEAVDATDVDPWGGIDESEETAKPVRRDIKPVRRDAERPRTVERPARKSNAIKIAIAAALLILIGGGFAAYKLVFETKDGTLVVEVDGDADVRFKNGELHVYGEDGKLKYTLKPGERSKAMPPGKYTVEVKSADGVKLNTDKFEMSKDGRVVLRVTADAIVVAKNGGDNKNIDGPGNISLSLSGEGQVKFPTLKELPLKGELTVEGFITLRGKHGGGISVFIGENVHCWIGVTDGCWSGYVFHEMFKDNLQLTPDRRVHLAIVRTPAECRFYLNGKFVASRKGSGQRLTDDHAEEFRLYASLNEVEFKEVRVSTIARYRQDFTPLPRFDADKQTLALYHCDEGQGDELRDSSGNNHHGKIVGAKWVKTGESPAPSPAADYALRFTGEDSVTFDKTLDYTPESFTIEAYVRPEIPAPNGVICTFNGQNGLLLDSVDGTKWRFSHTYDPKGYFGVKPPPVEFGKRVHVAAVSNQDGFVIYLDGKPAGRSAEGLARNLIRGKGFPRIGFRFQGVIDEVRISSKPRYDKDFTPPKRFEPDKDTLALYHFDEGQGDVLKDSSGNNHHGKIVGAKWVKANGTTTEPKQSPDPDRHAATVLLPHALHLRLKLASGAFQFVKPDDKLPAEPFTLIEIVFDKEMPADFVSNTLLPAIAGLRGLDALTDNALWLRWSETDLARLAAMPLAPTLSTLRTGFDFTSRSLEILKRFSGISQINGQANAADDALLLRLAELPRLTELGLTGLGQSGKITEKGWEAVTALPVVSLKLPTAKIPPAFAKRIASMSNLIHLYLQRAEITDEALKELAAHPKLELLVLDWIPISDVWIDHLRGMASLRHVTLRATKVTEDGVKKLASALPECRIDWSGGTIPPKQAPERRAVEWVLSLGGNVDIMVDGRGQAVRALADLPDKPFKLSVFEAPSAQPQAVTDAGLANLDGISGLVALRLYNQTMITDAGIERLASMRGLAELSELNLWGTQLTDKGMAHLKRFEKLRSLNIDGTSVTDAGLHHVGQMSKLEALSLGTTAITGEGLKHLRDLPALTQLAVSRKVNDAGLAHLRGTKIQNLRLDYSPGITSAGLKHLSDVTELTSLYLDGTSIGDDGLAHLIKLKRLVTLSVHQTNVTDMGLEHLRGLASLTNLNVTKTKVTADGVKKLTAALPRCKIEHDGGVIEPINPK